MADVTLQPDQPTLPGIDRQVPDEPKTASKNGSETKPVVDGGPPNLGKPMKVTVPNFADPNRAKTCLEVDFPIVPVNALSRLEGNAGKPIYQMSKWWARRRSSVFRAILVAAATQAPSRKNADGSEVLDNDRLPVPDETETARTVWDLYYANHQKAGNFENIKVLDCFMGGGTTLVEGSRLGFQVVGVDLNPVAWFVAKNELANTDPVEVQKFFHDIENELKPVIEPFYVTSCPRGHNGRWFRVSKDSNSEDAELMPSNFDPLTLPPEERKEFRYEGPQVIYTFWAKHHPCLKSGCVHRTPIFRSPVIAEKKLGVKYLQLTCKSCKLGFQAELGSARMAPAAERVILNSEAPFSELTQPFARLLADYSKGSTQEKVSRVKQLTAMVDAEPGLKCPRCGDFAGQYVRDILRIHQNVTRITEIDKKHFNIQPPRNGVKPVYSYLLIDPRWLAGSLGVADHVELGGYADAAVDTTVRWLETRLQNLQLIEVRGRIRLSEDTSEVVDGSTESASESTSEDSPNSQDNGGVTLEADRKDYGLPSSITLADKRQIDTRKGTVVAKATIACQFCGERGGIIEGLRKARHAAPLAPYALQGFCPQCSQEGYAYDGRFFSAPELPDIQRLDLANREWEREKESSLSKFWPQQEIPFGWQTHAWSIADHGYTHWYRMFNSRQLLVHASLLRKITEHQSVPRHVQEQALGAFQQYLRNQTMFCIWDISRDCMAPFFSNNHFVPRQLVVENCVFPSLGRGNWESCAGKVVEGLAWSQQPWEQVIDESGIAKSTKVFPGDPILGDRCTIARGSSSDLTQYRNESFDLVVTDPPFGDNFIYSEMANFFYAWLRLPLSTWYPAVCPLTDSPFAQEAVKNVAHHPTDADSFYKNMMTACWSEARRLLKAGGLMAFTFHHSEPTQWALVLEALFESGFYLEAIYPVTSDESKGDNAEFGSRKIEYDMLHVCRKRLIEPTPVSWAKMRQWVKAELHRLKVLLAAYKAKELSDADIRVILRGKALEFYSRHYGQVFTSEDEPLSIGHALEGINQVLDEGASGSRSNPPAIVQPIAYQYLRLFTTLSSRSTDDVTKSLFGTTIRQRDLEDRGWVDEHNRIISRIPIRQRFENSRMRPRKEMKTEVDQAHFLIGAALPGSGTNLEQELTKGTWMIRRSVDAVLEWYSERAPEPDIRDAAVLARAILHQTLEKLRKQPAELDRQLRMFNDWDEEL